MLLVMVHAVTDPWSSELQSALYATLNQVQARKEIYSKQGSKLASLPATQCRAEHRKVSKPIVRLNSSLHNAFVNFHFPFSIFLSRQALSGTLNIDQKIEDQVEQKIEPGISARKASTCMQVFDPVELL